MHFDDLLGNPFLFVEFALVELNPALPLDFPVPDLELAPDQHPGGIGIQLEILGVLKQFEDNVQAVEGQDQLFRGTLVVEAAPVVTQTQIRSQAQLQGQLVQGRALG